MPLQSGEPPRKYHQWPACRHLPRSTQGGDAPVVHARRVEGGKIHAARDGSDPAGLDGVRLGDVPGDERRDRDDPVAPLHDRVLAPFSRPVRGVGTVESRDEGPSRPAAPRSWRARAGQRERAWDEIHFLLGDQTYEAPDRTQRLQGVTARHRQRRVTRAGFGDDGPVDLVRTHDDGAPAGARLARARCRAFRVPHLHRLRDAAGPGEP